MPYNRREAEYAFPSVVWHHIIFGIRERNMPYNRRDRITNV